MLTRIFTKISKVRLSALPSFSCKSYPTLRSFNSSTFLASNVLVRRFSSIENKQQNIKDQMEESDNPLENLDLNDEAVRSVFETDLQTISLKFLKAVSPTEALKIFEQELEANPELGGDELAVVFYSVCHFKMNVTRDPRFKKLIEKIFVSLDKMSPVYLMSFIQTLGNFCTITNWTIPEIQQNALCEIITNNIQNYTPDQICDIASSIVQIIPFEQNRELLEKIIGNLLIASTNSQTPMSGANYASVLFTLLDSEIKSGEAIETLIQSITNNIERLSGEELNVITRIAIGLGEVQLNDSEIFVKIYENLIRPQVLNFPVEDIPSLILEYADKLPENKHYFHEMVKNVHVNYPDLTIEGYINIWLALAKYRLKADEVEKTLQVLKQVPFKASTWKLKDVEAVDLTNIIISTFWLGLNDPTFMKALTDSLQYKFQDLDDADLINITRIFTTKVAENKAFYLKVHEECCRRFNEFNAQEKKILKDTFARSQLGQELSPSPFL